MTISKYEKLLEKAKAEQQAKKGGSAFDEQMAKAKVNYYQSVLTNLRKNYNNRGNR